MDTLRQEVRENEDKMTDKLTLEEQKEKLAEIKDTLRKDKLTIKPYFGYLFWQISDMVAVMSPDDVMKQAVNLTLDSETDAIYAEFIATYVELWSSSNDFNAASRFIADALELSANELIEAKIYFEKTKAEL